MNKLHAALAGALALGLPLLASAQARRADPTDARASSPVLRYESAFADYKPYQDLKPGDWRALNEAVGGAAGGHGGHGMSMPAAPAASAPMPTASAPAHGGHPQHGGKR